MPRIETDVPKETLDIILEVWRMSRRQMSEEALRQLGWEELAAFAGDLLVLGFETASEDPWAFILETRERKAPIFKESGPSGRERDWDDESMRAYA